MTPLPQLPKAPTGIHGLDGVTGGGLPRGRPTLICGGPGCGKTLLAMQFLVHGAVRFEEPGVFIAFEETAPELSKNFGSLGFDLDDLVARRMLAIDAIDPREVCQSGEFDLEGLFIRLRYAIDQVGAKRVVLDTLETMFANLPSPATLRGELQRLFRWLKERGVTAVITGERGNDGRALTRQGLEEFVSDCVIQLEHRLNGAVSSRRLRVVKYRGSTHGTNEYPFLIDEEGISVLPVTALGLDHTVSCERLPTGITGLDAMLAGGGYFRGSSILVSGTAGTGKSSLAAHLTDATCRRGERVLYLAFEESAAQITRNMTSIGLDLGHWVERGL
ncbi:MAG TPA: circadian clock protein KaiC, partial [Polyangiales bacterium]